MNRWQAARHVGVAPIVALLVAMAPSAARDAPQPISAPPEVSSRPSLFRIAYTDPARAAEDAARYAVIVMNADAAAHIPTIRRRNPSAIVLVYKNLSFATTWDPTGISRGVGFDEASRHPEWFLLDDGGQRIESPWWPGNFAMDIASPAYQAAWAHHVGAELDRADWDGVFLDDVNWKASFAGNVPARYPSNDAWRLATTGFLRVVLPPVRERGELAVLNIGSGHDSPDGLWDEWLAVADGAMIEHFASWAEAPGEPRLGESGPWGPQLRQVVAATDAAKITLLRIGGVEGDREAIRYGVATYHLVNDGRQLIAPPRFEDPPTYPELTWDLGPPLGPRHRFGDVLHRREFTRGAVIVNASSSTVEVDLDETYIDHDGEPIRTLVLGPTSGAILRLPGQRPPAEISGPASPTGTTSGVDR